eukprot:13214506-Ditylum_brightwellii.AAC.1
MEAEYQIAREMTKPIDFAATNDPDTMYYHQAMQEPDRDKFINAIITEVKGHVSGKHWEMVPISKVPKGTKILDSARAFKRKHDIKTCKVYKHKACLNVHGGQQQYGVNYFDTYVPVVTWVSVFLIMILSISRGWHTRQIDFVMAYPHADIEHD